MSTDQQNATKNLFSSHALVMALLAALEATVIPLTRLGDFIGNEDQGGASGLGPFDRCAILLQVKAAIDQAKSSGLVLDPLAAEKAKALDLVIAQLQEAGFGTNDPINGGDCVDTVDLIYKGLIRKFPGA